jgi:hypothetical protein
MTAPAAFTMDHAPRAATTAALRLLLREREPHVEAGGRVRVSLPPSRTGRSLLRVAGPREAVLDYTAYLLSPAGAVPGPGFPSAELVAVEDGGGSELSLVLARPFAAWG